ncbi:hypothetical protein [Porphyromonas pogonae]|uniref:hypothetical protein n=1 Tax=Porphyromonas pogonae TaxID=867595 RepID=UPI002E796D84|nr:hypothetical protein [Porphyromonas pogonae]
MQFTVLAEGTNKHNHCLEMQRVREKIRAQKEAFLTKELNLTPTESKALMPILKELDNKRFDLWKSMLHSGKSNFDSLSTKDKEALFDQSLNNKVKEALLEKEYYTKCKAILPIDKLLKLRRANRKFAKQYVRESSI